MTNDDRWLVRSAEEVHFDYAPDIQDTDERWDAAYSKAMDYVQQFNLTQKVRSFLHLHGGSQILYRSLWQLVCTFSQGRFTASEVTFP